MKLLFCPSCWDMRRISRYHEEPTVCSCGRGQAQRKEGGSECWWNGKGLILELADTDLAHLNLANEYDGLRGEDRIWLHKVADGKIEIRPQEEATITNDGVGGKALGNYLIRIQDKKGITFRSARVHGFPRLRCNAWHLLYLALRDAGMAQC